MLLYCYKTCAFFLSSEKDLSGENTFILNSNINTLNTMIHDISSDFTGSISGGFGDLTVTLTFSSLPVINPLFGGYGVLVIYIMATKGSSMSLCTYKHDGSDYVFSSKALSNDKSFGVIPTSVNKNK